MDNRHIDNGLQRLKDLLKLPIDPRLKAEIRRAVDDIELGVVTYDDVISGLEQRRHNDDNFPGGVIGWLDDDYD